MNDSPHQHFKNQSKEGINYEVYLSILKQKSDDLKNSSEWYKESIKLTRSSHRFIIYLELLLSFSLLGRLSQESKRRILKHNLRYFSYFFFFNIFFLQFNSSSGPYETIKNDTQNALGSVLE